MLTVHHLGVSQSERIVWLCEELGIPYDLKLYQREPSKAAPPDYRALHPTGNAPVITDSTKDGGDLVLAESGAIVDYIIAKHGDGRLALAKAHPGFAQYLYWFHFANGTLQPALMRVLVSDRLGAAADHPAVQTGRRRMAMCLAMLEKRLGEEPWLAGNEFTAADIMTVFCLTTMRHYLPYDLSPFPCILQYLARVGARPAYQRAMLKADPGMKPLLG